MYTNIQGLLGKNVSDISCWVQMGTSDGDLNFDLQGRLNVKLIFLVGILYFYAKIGTSGKFYVQMYF